MHAHENHLYLGLLLSIVVVAAPSARSLNWPLQGLLAAQFLNIFSVHGLGLDNDLPGLWVPSGLPDLYLHSDVFQLIVVAVTVVCWAWLLVGFVRLAGNATRADHEHLLGQRAYGET